MRQLLKIPMDTIIRVHGILYNQTEPLDLKEGDLVLDLGDGAYGYVDMIKEDKIAIKDGRVAEVGVPISRVRKLVFSPLTNSDN